MPLNSASYDAARNKIYAVRGGYVLRFDGSTGVREASARYATSQKVCLGDESYCWYDSVLDVIWANIWRGTWDANASITDVALVKINPTTLAVVTEYSLTSDIADSITEIAAGPRQIQTDGSNLYFSAVGAGGGLSSYSAIYLYDANNIPASWLQNGSYGGNRMWAQFDLANGVLYQCDVGNLRRVREVNKTTLATTGVQSAQLAIGRFIYGICWSPSNSRIYACTKTRYIHKLEMGGAQAALEIDTGRANATPHNIRYNANDGLIYCPLYSDNTVVVIDPSTDAVTVKTGFDSPWDCVFSTTKKWALQHGPQGLKEIV